MQNQIFEFYLTHHFMLRGWDRKVDKTLLKKVLPFVTVNYESKKLVIVTPSFLAKKGVSWAAAESCLVLVLRCKTIKTAYWTDCPNRLFKKEKNVDFQIIY